MRYRPRPEAPATGTILGLVPENRRRSVRHAVRNLAYVQLDGTSVGVVRDVSEFGIATQAVAPVQPDQAVRVRLDLPSPRLRVEAEGRVVWANASGEAGIEFTNLSTRMRAALKEWIFTQLLAGAYRTAGNVAEELLFSEAARPAIRVITHTPRRSLLSRLRLPASSFNFARLVDSLVILCAVLLFSIIALFMTDTLPAWYLAIPLLAGVGVIFWGLYWFMFSFWFGTTAGRQLATLAGVDRPMPVKVKEEEMRFR